MSVLCAFSLFSLLSYTHSFSLMVTGDVNLNPDLAKTPHINNFTFVWGDMLPVLLDVDLLAINHESTLAGINLDDPDVIQFEDPLNYVDTYGPAGIGAKFITQANNHQFDFSFVGVKNTVEALNHAGLTWAGLGNTPEEVRTPKIVKSHGGVPVAFFTLVIDECWKWANGSLYLDACTCGENSGPPPAYQCYSAGASGIPTGLWYNFGLSRSFISEVMSTIGQYKKAHPQHLVVSFLHFGPNFQWQPYPEHEEFLRNVSTVSDLVWGTSSHHIQRFEVWNSKPIIYGLGDLVFRHVPGVDDWCPIYGIPCEQYRPELALAYKFEVAQDPSTGFPHVDLNQIYAYPSRHDAFQTFRATDKYDLEWIQNTLNEMSSPHGATVAYDEKVGAFKINVSK